MRTRWVNYANQAVFNAWYRHTNNMTPKAAFGGTNLQQVNDYSPWGANNPRNNYYYSFLTATMMLGLATQGENPQADGWLGQFRTAKLAQQLIPVFNGQLEGGGSREGTGYGTALRSLVRLYYWWEQSTGQRIHDQTPHTKASLAHFMHNMVPTLDRYATTGDQARDELGMLFDYQLDYMKILMQLYPTDRLSAVSKSLIAQATPSSMTQQFMYQSDFMYDTGSITAQPLSNLATTYFGKGTGMFATRGSWTTGAAYANFICGPNDESHAHNDQGSFTLYRGTWLAIDANMDMTSGLAQSEHVHNLVRFQKNGSNVAQNRYNNPCEMRVAADNSNYSYAEANLLPVYAANGGSNITRVERRFLFIKPGVFVVFDPVTTAGSGMKKIWTMNVPNVPSVSGNQISYVAGSNRMDIHRISPPTGADTTLQVLSWKSVTPLDWSEVPKATATAHRIDLANTAVGTTNFLHVIGTNGAISGVPVQDDGTNQSGTTFNLADGRTVTVRFNNDARGGSVVIKQGSTILVNELLPDTVQAIPLFAN